MMSFKMEGLENLSGSLEDLGRKARALDGQHRVPFGELFIPAFMIQWTDFSSLDEMVRASGFKVESAEDFEAIPDNEWDEFVKTRTRFPNWKEMMEAASGEWVRQKLGLE